MNPFLTLPNIISLDQLIQRTNQIKILNQYMDAHTDTVLFGPEGSGKSALLNSFFNFDYRRKMVNEKTLIAMMDFPTGKDGEFAYGFFADALRNCVESLEFFGKIDESKQLLDSMNRNQYDSNQSRFSNYMSKISMCGYHIVFVLDNFENFTTSPEIKEEHHDMLCGFLNSHKLQMIVATNYDFNKTSLPQGAHNSTLLSRLYPNKIDMTPLDPEGCTAYLTRVLERPGCDFRFTEDQVQFIYDLSGGIPYLVHTAAKFAYQALSEACSEDWMFDTREHTLKEVRPILKRWCKIMTPEQRTLLAEMVDEKLNLTGDEKSTAAALRDRGILQSKFFIDSNGKRRSTDGYLYNCELLKDFSSNPDWMKEAAESNPFRKDEVLAGSFDPRALMGGVYVEKIELHQGDNVYNGPTIVGGFDKIFDVLDLAPDQLTSRLQDMFRGALPQAQDVEQTAECISSVFIPEELESENQEVVQKERETLETRFASVRARVYPDLDDALLASLSTRCRQYVQIAFVVDDALAGLGDFRLGDLSARMVMYGKALEQNLRDNLYDLFHQDDKLKYYDTRNERDDQYAKETFSALAVKKTNIGNYMHMMWQKSYYLHTLCKNNAVSYGTAAISNDWWKQLGNDVNTARDLRNRTDHAGTETDENNLKKMRDLLFGNKEILKRCAVGGELTRKLFPTPDNAPKPAPEQNCEHWIGKTVVITNTKSNSSGNLGGNIEGRQELVSLSKNHLKSKGYKANSIQGRRVRVQITRWDDNGQKYNADLCEVLN